MQPDDFKRNVNQEFYKDMLRFQRTFLAHKPPDVWSPKVAKPVLDIAGIEPIDIFKTRDVPRKLAPIKAILPPLRNPEVVKSPRAVSPVKKKPPSRVQRRNIRFVS